MDYLRLLATIYHQLCRLSRHWIAVAILSVIGLSWHPNHNIGNHEDSPTNLSHNTANFTITWQHHSLQITHTSGRILLQSPPDTPFISPAVINDGATPGVTIRFNPQIKLNPSVLGTITKLNDETGPQSVMYAINLNQFCRKYVLVTFTEIHAQALEVSAKIAEASPHEPYHRSCEALAMTLSSHNHERFVGLGTQTTLLNLNGHRFTTLSQEQGHGRGLQPLTWITNQFGKGTGGDETTSYHTVNHVLSNHLRSFWLYSERHAHFDFSQPTTVTIAPTEPFLRMRFNLGHSVQDLVQEFAGEFGTTKPIPQWVHRGAIMGLQGGESHVTDTIETLRDYNTPITSIWIQDWLGSFKTLIGQRLVWHWKTDHKLYPYWDQFVKDLTHQNLNVLSYFNPRIKNSCVESCYFQMAKHNEYLVKNRLGEPYLIGNGGFDFAKIDLFHLSAKNWLAELIRDHFRRAPVKGWMADFSEAVPLDAVLADGTTGMASHNRYIYEWAKFNGQLIDEIDDGFVFMRSGILGSHQFVHAFWLGDQLTTWDRYDGLHSTIIGLITSGLSGALVNHSDIGGLTNLRIPFITHLKRTKELFLRWMQMNAFTPIFRTHEGLRPQLAHQFNSDHHTLAEFARYARIFASLFPYRQKLVTQTQVGIPMVRGMFFEYPHLNEAWLIDDQFMLGDELIIAPVVEPAATQRSVFLPPGCWIEVFSQTVYNISSARHITVAISADHIPVFALQHSQAYQLLTDVIRANPATPSS